MFLSHSAACLAAADDPARPLSRETLILWHTKVNGPRDTNGRRIFDAETVAQIKRARAESMRRSA